MPKIFSYILLVLFFVNFSNNSSLIAEEIDSISDYTPIEYIRYILQKHRVDNEPAIEFQYGSGNYSLPAGEFSENLARTYSGIFRYGFVRIDTEIFAPTNLLFANDFVYLGNISSHLKPKFIPKPGITSDGWIFGLGYKNGTGYILPDSALLILYHSASIELNHIDFEEEPLLENNKKTISIFDDQYRFGNSFEAGINYNVFSIFYFGISYKKSLIYKEFSFGKWFGSQCLELICQRSIDYFIFNYLQRNPDIGPIVGFVIKNGLSFVLYELKFNKSFYPFNSGFSLSSDSYQMEINLFF